jgi:hypothetical protein
MNMANPATGGFSLSRASGMVHGDVRICTGPIPFGSMPGNGGELPFTLAREAKRES